MIFVKHRANNISDVQHLDTKFGAEIDLRIFKGEIVLAHDAFQCGVRFQDWIGSYSGSLLILNIKEMGIEKEVVDLVQNHQITDYFLLDLSFPYLKEAQRLGYPVAGRVSDYELLENALLPNVNWLWLDSFSANWSYLDEVLNVKSNKRVKTCLVSPELQGRQQSQHASEFKYLSKFIEKNPNAIDAICTKNIDYWEKES